MAVSLLRWVTFALTACLVWAIPRAAAQGPQDSLRRGCLFSAQTVLRISVLQGRITAQAQETLSLTQATTQSSDGRQETLRIQTTGGATTVLYVIVEQDAELTFDLQAGNEVRIRRRPRNADAGPPIDFRQPARGPMQLEVGDGPERQVVRAPSLWHLLLVEPELSRVHLVPLVEILQPSLRLNATAGEIRDNLFAAADAPDLPLQDEVHRLVRQLASAEFRQRQAADRALRRLGPGIGPQLMAIDPRLLTVEQRERIRNILDGLAGPTTDTPERIAAWLVTDSRIWIELLADARPERREAALAHLTRLTGKVVPFDPRAGDEVRAKQLQALRRAP